MKCNNVVVAQIYYNRAAACYPTRRANIWLVFLKMFVGVIENLIFIYKYPNVRTHIIRW